MILPIKRPLSMRDELLAFLVPTLLLATLNVIANALIRGRSHSLWPGVILHTGGNAYILYLLSPLTIPTLHTVYLVGVSSALTLAMGLALGSCFWSLRKQLLTSDAAGNVEKSTIGRGSAPARGPIRTLQSLR